MKKQQREIKLSVVILNYNTRGLLDQCLNSLPRQSDYQIIVVDNASTDGSVAMVSRKYPWVLVIASLVNDGFTRGNDKARGKALGEYVLFLNSDTVVGKNVLSAMVKFMDDTPDAGVSTCLTVLPNGSLYYACHRGFPTPWNSFCYFVGLAKVFPRVKLLSGYTATYLSLDKIHEIDACSGTFILIRKRLLDQIGWFDEDYFSYGEDIEMCYRVKELGYKVMFVPTVKIRHYWGASSGLKSTSVGITSMDEVNTKRWNEARYEAMKIFYDKHYRGRYPEVVRWIVFKAIVGAIWFRMGRD